MEREIEFQPLSRPRATRVERLARFTKWAALAVVLLSLLTVRSRLGDWLYPTLLGVPLVIAAVRGRDHAFLFWTLYAVTFKLFVVVRQLADDLGAPVRAAYVAAADQAIGIGTVPTLALQRWFYVPAHTGALDWLAIATHLSYYPAPALTGIGLWLWARDRFPRYMSAVVVMYAAGAVIHVLIPTVPPWMAARDGLLPPVHRVLEIVLDGVAPGFFTYGNAVAGGNDVAAMPSLHAAAAVMVALALTGKARVLGWCYAVTMALSLAYLGEHYIIDTVAGAALAVASWRVAPRVASLAMRLGGHRV